MEVVAGDRLVDRQEPQLPVVVLAQVALHLLRRPVLVHRGDGEERLLALVERPWRVEHRATEAAQELRRPPDVERLVDERDHVVVAAERLDPGELRDAHIEELVGAGVIARDDVQGAAHQRRLVVRYGLAWSQLRPQLRGQPEHLPADRGELALRDLEQRVRRRLGVAQRMAELRREPLRPEETVTRRGGHDDLAKVDPERSDRLARALLRRAEARQDGLDIGVTGGRRGVTLADRVPPELRDPVDPLRGRFRVQPRHRTVREAAQRGFGVLEDGRDPFEPAGDRRQTVGERREVARREREQPEAQEIDPVHRVPRVIAQLGLGVAQRGELAHDEVPIEALVGGEGRRRPGRASSATQPSIQPSRAVRPAPLVSGQRSSCR